jgi:hypothetical protein
LSPLGTVSTNRPTVPDPGDYDDGEIGGMIGRENRSTRRKPAPVPLCLPQTPHAVRTRTWAAAFILLLPEERAKPGNLLTYDALSPSHNTVSHFPHDFPISSTYYLFNPSPLWVVVD